MDHIAIISDVHGNMPALETVLADIQQRGITHIYNLGDIVGKGPRSDLALDRCCEVCQVIVRGNWEDFILTWDENTSGAWYRAQLGAERLATIRALPNVHDFWLSGKRVRLYHASHESVHTRIRAWETYETHRAMFSNTAFTGFDEPEPDIVGYGDIHSAYMLTLSHDHKILFNAGSVGNPLDLPLATYAILSGTLHSREPGAFSLDFVRLPYDVEATIAQAHALNVPEVAAYERELRTAVYRGRQKSSA
ncbi:metallophosphoesterase family protein [bacterium]|nr:metallophosphoesterase family protein [bacterium]